ncbi:MAG: Long-chain-fatty-acid--CoA ligase [Candidatus Thorarchaeota archaeon AB_25]|nr:MAG: Long-chain-fatty-acid--CoA ligase [Candidatus Thorarchaeota archaeon AB_25]
MPQLPDMHPINIGMLLTRNSQCHPNHLGIIFEEKRLTFQDFNRNVNRIANALRDLGIEKGDKIAIVLPNCLELLELYWGIAKLGAVAVPLSTLLMSRGLKSLITDSDAKMVVTNSQFMSIIEEIKPELANVVSKGYILIDNPSISSYQDYHALKAEASDNELEDVEVDENDPYNIIYSSGTTGLPKGIVLSHYVRAYYATLFASSFRMTPESVVIHSGSLVFNGSFVTLMPAMLVGATYILHSRFDAQEFIETVQREKVTHVIMVPSQLIAILNAPNFSVEALESLEMICSVGAPLHMDVKERLNQLLPNRFYELYGLTEGFITILDRTHYASKPQSVGVPPPFYQIRIVNDSGEDVPVGEIGEIVGRGPTLMTEYYKRPDLTAQAIKDGWLYSGDLGYVDDNDFLYLVDRKKDMIISGGVNVYPKDIEEVVSQHPAVGEVAVFGIPDTKWGESSVAAVSLKQPNMVTAEELLKWVNERVGAKFQRVHQVFILDEFPRGISGKILKRVLRDEYIDSSQ